MSKKKKEIILLDVTENKRAGGEEEEEEGGGLYESNWRLVEQSVTFAKINTHTALMLP